MKSKSVFKCLDHLQHVHILGNCMGLTGNSTWLCSQHDSLKYIVAMETPENKMQASGEDSYYENRGALRDYL